jgi:hypothetical protein
MASKKLFFSCWVSLLALNSQLHLPHAATSSSSILGEWPGFTRGPALDVKIHNNHAYVAAGPAGVMIFDLTDPRNPSRISGIRTEGWVASVALAGDLLVVPQLGWPTRFYNIANPRTPQFLLTLAARVDGTDITIHGDLALVTGLGLEIIDLSVPSQPTPRGFVPLGYASSVAVSGHHAFVAVYQYGLAVIDISDPDRPAQIGSYINDTQASGLLISNGYIFLGNSLNEIDIVDVSDPRNPAKVGTFTPATMYDGAFFGGALSEVTAFFASAMGGLEVIDLSEPKNPQSLGRAETAGVATSVAVQDNYAYVADSLGGLHTFDISDPSRPTPVSEFTSQGAAMASVIRGNIALTADGDAGLRIFDLKKTTLTPLARIPTTSFTSDIEIRGHLAFVADSQAGFKIVDFSNPLSPDVLSSIESIQTKPFPQELGGGTVALMNNLALVANLYRKVHIIDISDPLRPLLLTTHSSSNQFTAITTKGSVAFLAHTEGLEVIDLTDPRRPSQITNFSATAHAYDLEINGNRLYLPAGTDGLHIFDVSNPLKPKRAGKYIGSVAPNGITTAGKYAFITDRNSPRLEVVNIRNPRKTQLKTMDLPSVAFDISVRGNRALLSCAQDGFFLLDLSNILGPALEIRFSNGTPVLEVTGVPGRELILEFASDLSSTDGWKMTAPILLQNERQLLSVPSDQARFYRVSWKSD